MPVNPPNKHGDDTQCCSLRPLLLVAREIGELLEEILFRVKSLATKRDLERTEKHIMAGIKDYTDAVDAKMEELSTGIDTANTAIAAVTTSANGIQADVLSLKATIDKLQNSPGQISPQDQALLDTSLAKATALVDKTTQHVQALQTASDTLKQLDDQTDEDALPEAPPIPNPA